MYISSEGTANGCNRALGWATHLSDGQGQAPRGRERPTCTNTHCGLADFGCNCWLTSVVFYNVIFVTAQQRLLKIVKKNKIDVIFPGSDKELIFFAKNINFFKERELFIPINNLKTINLCLDKSALNDQLYKLGYTPPKSIKFSLSHSFRFNTFVSRQGVVILL